MRSENGISIAQKIQRNMTFGEKLVRVTCSWLLKTWANDHCTQWHCRESHGYLNCQRMMGHFGPHRRSDGVTWTRLEP